jgi:hypothetical protein
MIKDLSGRIWLPHNTAPATGYKMSTIQDKYGRIWIASGKGGDTEITLYRDYSTNNTMHCLLRTGGGNRYYAKYNLDDKTWSELISTEYPFGLNITSIFNFGDYCYYKSTGKFEKSNYLTGVTSEIALTGFATGDANATSMALYDGNSSTVKRFDLDLNVVITKELKDSVGDTLPHGGQCLGMNDSNIYVGRYTWSEAYIYDLSGNYVAEIIPSASEFNSSNIISNTRSICVGITFAPITQTLYLHDLGGNLIKTITDISARALFDDRLIIIPANKLRYINIYDINGNLLEEREIIDSSGQPKDG